MLRTFPLLVLLAGCAISPSRSGLPPAGGAGAPVLPIVRLEPGQTDTLDLSDRLGSAARFEAPAGVHADVLGGGRAVFRAQQGFRDVALVPFTVGSDTYALAVDAAGAAGRLHLQVEGIDAEDTSLLRFSVRPPAGGDIHLDEEEGVVVLLDDQPYQDNAIDAYDGTVVIDLDATGPGRQRLRLAARTDGRVSNWVEVDLVDGRPIGLGRRG